MRWRLLTIVVLFAGTACARPAPVLRSSVTSHDSAIVLRARWLLDVERGTRLENAAVVVRGDRIVAAGRAADVAVPAHARNIELGDRTIMPGLIDAHVHLTIGGRPGANAAAILRAGFTTVADLGAVSQRVQALRDSIARGVMEGPRILAAGLWIGVKGGVCEFRGIGVAGGADAFRARVRENVAAHANLIKACVTGWPAVAWGHPDSVEMAPPILAALVDEAHRAGRRVVAHALSREGVRMALDAGVDGLAHAAYVDEALATRMRERGMWMIPTLASLTAADTSAAARGLADAVRVAHRVGVTLVYGTDGGVLPHGENAAEAVALAAVGVSPAEILRSATIHAARALGIADSLGTVRRGMIADLIAVDGDPLSDVSTLARPRFVMARGRMVSREP